ncbi:hypothetical protein DP116_28455, partial [Brasilonema bromeliae SPC951]|nr:hypothetical protein [Brasilonema bromeliae SPC951]
LWGGAGAARVPTGYLVKGTSGRGDDHPSPMSAPGIIPVQTSIVQTGIFRSTHPTSLHTRPYAVRLCNRRWEVRVRFGGLVREPGACRIALGCGAGSNAGTARKQRARVAQW